MDVFLGAGESTSLDLHGDEVLDQTRQVRREFRPVLTPLVAVPADGSQSPCASVISTLEVFDGGGMLVASGIVSDLAPGTVFVLKSPLPEGACADLWTLRINVAYPLPVPRRAIGGRPGARGNGAIAAKMGR